MDTAGQVAGFARKYLTVGGVILVVAVLSYATAFRLRARQSPSTKSDANLGQLVGKHAPDFELKSLDGRPVRLGDFHGKAVLLNFWATYCAPCRLEMPWLVDLYGQYQKQGLEVVGVSMDDDQDKGPVTEFVRQLKVGYPILLGERAVADAYGGARYLPQTFFINRDGDVVGSATGLMSRSEFESAVKQLLSKGGTTR